MITGNDIRDLAYDMNIIGLEITNKKDLEYFIKRLEKSLATAKFCLDKPLVVDAATIGE